MGSCRSVHACGRALAVLGLALTVASAPRSAPAAAPAERAPKPPLDYRAKLFHVTGCPQSPAGDHFLGLSNLLAAMGHSGLKLYKSSALDPLAGPDGIVASHDVVVLKINYQWDQRGGTNTDLLRGLIRAIEDHPDGFTGEVIVCENAQFVAVEGFDRAQNNAQDHGLSPHDVVVGFQQQGRAVSHCDWTALKSVQVAEYSAGDSTDGYVVEAYDDSLRGRLSYPKFRTAAGARVSVRYGIWDPGRGAYDRARLKFINLPVLKSHHAVYGATASVKNYMGVVTNELATSSHGGVRYGMMGALLAAIQPADLNILDAIWINANPNSGPATSYEGATRRDELVAGRDPIALDYWSVKNILVPAFLANGFAPPWPDPSADPDDPTSAFRVYLDNSMNQLLAAGRPVTNNPRLTDVVTANGAAGDFDGNGTVDASDYVRFVACFTGPGGGPAGSGCSPGDFDGDGDVDCSDWRMFKAVWTGSDPVPQLPACDMVDAPADGASGPRTFLLRPNPNPMAAATRIDFSIAAPGRVRLEIFDVRGRTVARLLDGDRPGGRQLVAWDGRDAHGDPVPSGVYFCRLRADGVVVTRRMTLVR